MRVGLDTYSYHRLLGSRRPGEPGRSVRWDVGWRAVVGEARRLGVDTLALQTMFLPPPEELDAGALRAAAGPLELVVSWGGAEGLRFGADAAAEDELHRWIALAPELGATLVRIVVGGPALRRQPMSGHIRRVVPALRRAAGSAAVVGVTLAVENHGDLTVPELVDLLDQAGCANVGVCLDVLNVMRLGGDPVEGARMLADRVRMVHLRDGDDPAGADVVSGPRVRAYGRGVVPIDAVLGALASDGFDGPVCVELAQLGDGDDECEIVAACVGWLRQRLAACEEVR